jgi:hypothetical protein
VQSIVQSRILFRSGFHSNYHFFQAVTNCAELDVNLWFQRIYLNLYPFQNYIYFGLGTSCSRWSTSRRALLPQKNGEPEGLPLIE